MADDLEVLGLHVSPDLDSILYALAGLADEERGWGRVGRVVAALETVAALGGEAWFSLGDRDLGLHLVRTQLLREGVPLSEVTARLARALGLARSCCRRPTRRSGRSSRRRPEPSPSRPGSSRRGHRDEVDAVHYAGAPEAAAGPGVVEALGGADLIVIAPSNPYVSIGPILAVAEIRAALAARDACRRWPSARSIGGRAVKGPADRMLLRLAGGTTPAHVAGCYAGLIDALVVDASDEAVELPAGVRRSSRTR